jgi:acetyl-CoA acyltransferase
VRPDDLAAVTLAALKERNPGIAAGQVTEIILGCANQAGEDNRNVARMSGLLAGFPVTTAGTTINRLCGSGLDAVIAAARSIKAGEADVVIAGGTESMSRAPFVLAKSEGAFSRAAEIHDSTIGWRFINPRLQSVYGTDSMPETAENVARQFAISRQDQDTFALRSQQRSEIAGRCGRLKEEIVPVSVPQRKGPAVVVASDEHPRANTKLEDLARLRPIVPGGETVTAGNSSGVNDGAAALIVASERGMTECSLRPIARIVAGAACGVEPRIMGIGPAPATKKLCEQLDWPVSTFDVIELNEAFASQALAVLRSLELPDDADHVNPNGGAIALGHPLGMSGARLAGTVALELRRRQGRRALATMCIGVGQGIALALEAV